MGEWKEYRIEDVCSRITSGSTPSRKRLDYFGGTIPWLSSKEVNFNRIDRTDEHITEAGLRNSSAKWIEPNAVIVAMYGATAGRVALSRIRLTTNQACCNLTTDLSKCDYEYLFYFLTSKYEELVQLSTGVAQQNLSLAVLKEFPLLLPSVGEQRAIASVLSSLDAKIDLLRRQNKTLEAMAETLFRQWFVEEAEEGWEEKTVADIAEVNSGKRPPERFEVASSEARVPVWGGNGPMAYTREALVDSEVLLTGRVGTLGSIFRINTPIWPSDNTLLLTARRQEAKEFLFQQLRSIDFAQLNRGSTQPLLTQSDLKAQSFLMPPDELLLRYHEITRDLYAKVDANLKANQTLTALRDTLLPKLMSGEVRVEEYQHSNN